MTGRDRERIIARYNARLAKYGDDLRTLAGGTEERRQLRFRVLHDVGLTPGCSVLDVGCGFGDFLAYLRTQAIDVRYVGIDINPSLVEVAQRKFPDAQFRVADLRAPDLPPCDFVVSSNAFNLKLLDEDNYEFMADMFARSQALARCGVAIDLLTTYVDYPSPPEAFHYSPERIFSIAKSITKRVMLRHDYPLFEFCIYLFPDFEGWAPRL